MENEQELKDLLRRNLELAQDNNRMLHAMRRNARLAAVGHFVYWVAFIALLGASYYFYVAPYVQKFEQAYESFQSNVKKTQSQADQAQQFLGNLQQSFQKYFPPSKQ